MKTLKSAIKSILVIYIIAVLVFAVMTFVSAVTPGIAGVVAASISATPTPNPTPKPYVKSQWKVLGVSTDGKITYAVDLANIEERDGVVQFFGVVYVNENYFFVRAYRANCNTKEFVLLGEKGKDSTGTEVNHMADPDNIPKMEPAPDGSPIKVAIGTVCRVALGESL
jgi:hypothetical protein